MKKFLSVLLGAVILAGPLACSLPARASGDLPVHEFDDLLAQAGDDFMVQADDDSEEEEAVLCTICQEDCQDGQIVTTECCHKFHEGCLLAWFEHGGDVCPNCRRIIVRQGAQAAMPQPPARPEPRRELPLVNPRIAERLAILAGRVLHPNRQPKLTVVGNTGRLILPIGEEYGGYGFVDNVCLGTEGERGFGARAADFENLLQQVADRYARGNNRPHAVTPQLGDDVRNYCEALRYATECVREAANLLAEAAVGQEHARETLPEAMRRYYPDAWRFRAYYTPITIGELQKIVCDILVHCEGNELYRAQGYMQFAERVRYAHEHYVVHIAAGNRKDYCSHLAIAALHAAQLVPLTKQFHGW